MLDVDFGSFDARTIRNANNQVFDLDLFFQRYTAWKYSLMDLVKQWGGKGRSNHSGPLALKCRA
jgi:hypothetical protein